MSTKELQLQFVQEVLNARPEENELFKEFDRLVHHDFVAYADGNSTYHQKSASLMRLQEICRQLELVVADSQFHQKGQVAVAGCFSSGKSAFINSFFQRAQKQESVRLPIDSTPTTSIASYVVDGLPSVRGFSYEGGRVDISPQLFRMFRHGQEDGFEFNVKKIVSRIVVSTPWSVEFPHICLVDTPGFDSGTEQMGSDDSAALAAIAEADGVVWCVSVEAGTLTDKDCDLLLQLRDLNPRLRLYLVLTHADLKSLEECQDILLEVADTLEAEGIEVEGICPYCSKQGVGSQDESLRNAGRGMGLEDFLRGIPPRSMRERLLEPIQEVFRGYREADRKRIAVLEQERKDLNVIGNLYTAEVDGLEATVSRLKARLAALGGDAGERIEEEKKGEVAETADDAAWVRLSDVHAAWQSLSESVKKSIEAFVTLTEEMGTELQEDPELQESLREAVEILLHQIYCDSFDRYETMPDFESWLSYVQHENLEEVVYDYLSRLASWESSAESLPEHLAPWESSVESLPERLAVWRRQLAEEIAVHERDMQAADALCGKMTGLVEKIFGGQVELMTPSLSEKRSKSEKCSNREVLLRCIHDACDDITQGCWIGGRGPGGGIVFHIDGSNAYEVSEVLGKHRWAEAKRVAEGYRGGGFGDWRLPTKEELNLVYRRLRKPGVITGDETFWSSSQYNGSHPDFHRAQRFGDGGQDYYYDAKHYFRAIRVFNHSAKPDCDAGSAPAKTVIRDMIEVMAKVVETKKASVRPRAQGCRIERTGPGGGIVFHIDGKRAYEVSEVLGKFEWAEAKRVAEGYRGGGFGDWRLPTKEELDLVYQRLRKPGVITDDEWFWSSSKTTSRSETNSLVSVLRRARGYGDIYDIYWAVRFSDGGQDNYRDYSVFCVRAIRVFNIEE